MEEEEEEREEDGVKRRTTSGCNKRGLVGSVPFGGGRVTVDGFVFVVKKAERERKRGRERGRKKVDEKEQDKAFELCGPTSPL